MIKNKYDTSKFDFKTLIEKSFGVEKLQMIRGDYSLLKRKTDQCTAHHRLFYDKVMVSDSFLSLYKNFIKENVRPLYDNSIVVQKLPTFRVCYPNNIAVGEYHKDKWYRDRAWAEKVKELNFFLPFTRAYDTNTIWVESEEDKADYSPMNCEYGEFIQWDGSNLMHGNHINSTGKTRVSIDFRVVEYKNYEPSDKGSINTDMKFKLGDYYELYE
jgi:hypothetical protein